MVIIKKKWLIDKGFLFSTQFWGEKKIYVAERYFPGQQLRIFISGDGHGEPPFKWAAQTCWKNYLNKFKGKICCHVELTQKDVLKELKKGSTKLVPKEILSLCGKKVFGWEPKVIEYVNELTWDFNDFVTFKLFNVQYIKKLYKNMDYIERSGFLRKEFYEATELLEKCINDSKIYEQDWIDLVNEKYVPKIVDLRIDPKLHHEIAKKIQEKINRYKDHVHLIACGPDHLRINPLYKYLHVPNKYFGIVDESSS